MEIVVSKRLGERLKESKSVIERAVEGDADAHKVLTFGQRYGSREVTDKRVYSRDPEEIKAYYRDLGITKETFNVRNPED